jgi:ribosomal RNA-processing protein 1
VPIFQHARLTFATDKEVRDQALESLRTFLGAQAEIAELDLLKLWKGLFYCMLRPAQPPHPTRTANALVID